MNCLTCHMRLNEHAEALHKVNWQSPCDESEPEVQNVVERTCLRFPNPRRTTFSNRCFGEGHHTAQFSFFA